LQSVPGCYNQHQLAVEIRELDHFDPGVRSVPMSHHRLLFALGMCFTSDQCICSAISTATCCTFWSNVNIFGTHQAQTTLNSKCSWVIVLTLQIFNATVGCSITHCNSPVSKNLLLDVANVHIMYSSWHAVSLRLLYVHQKTHCTTNRHLNMTWSLPHTMHLTCEEFCCFTSFF
jgi:hypothetical protein